MVDEGWSYEDALKTAQELGYAEVIQPMTLKVLTLPIKLLSLVNLVLVPQVSFDDVTHKGDYKKHLY